MSISRRQGVGFIAAGIVLGLFACPVAARAAEPAEGTSLQASRVTTAPVIDGLLDDEAWRSAELQLGEWRSYNPLHGDRIPQQTHVWIAYDTRYLYFAFQCDDPEPDRIKTSVTRRDNIFSDDWVGLSLDALGTGQVAYHMMVNPSGVQLDMLNSISGDEDLAPDWIWDSAGRRNDRGYAVEIRLPLESIRFSGGADARMGILFWRRVSRIGVSVSWPALEPGKWVFEKHAGLHFADLHPRQPREVIPSATYAWSETRARSRAWDGDANQADLGFSTKLGLAPTVTLDATLNPDFSQVESDAFQVEINQRFPVFFSEKRPFFMEGSDIFKLAGVGNGDASMSPAVHTRRIVDPILGVKLTGSAGRVTFGSLNASDEAPGHEVAVGERGRDENRLFNIGRVQYSLGPGSYAGAIVTDARFAGDTNQVAGADLAWRPRSNDKLNVFVLQSWSDRRGEHRSGAAMLANYSSSTQRYTVVGQVEHYDRGFRMDTAFYNRVGFTNGWGYVEVSFYPDKTRYPWLRRISPFTFNQGGRDREAGGSEFLNVSGARISFTRQGFLRIDRSTGHEAWAHREFPSNRWRTFGNVQLYRWLGLEGSLVFGDAVYYDETNPFAGHSRTGSAGVVFQPTGRFTQDVSYTRVVFDRADTGAHVYSVDLLNTRTTYQFTRQLFLRAIVQYDSSRHRVLTDFLGSYELRPGTVVFAGYGSLLERRSFEGGEWVLGRGSYGATRRGIFLKASYRHGF
jgi:hypothetical protein